MTQRNESIGEPRRIIEVEPATPLTQPVPEPVRLPAHAPEKVPA